MKKFMFLIALLVITGSLFGQSRDPKQYLNRYLLKTVVNDSLSNYGLNWTGISTTTGAFTGAVSTGALTASSITATSTGATVITGSATATDSTTSVILKDSGGKKWKLRVYTNGALKADSTGLN